MQLRHRCWTLLLCQAVCFLGPGRGEEWSDAAFCPRGRERYKAVGCKGKDPAQQNQLLNFFSVLDFSLPSYEKLCLSFQEETFIFSDKSINSNAVVTSICCKIYLSRTETSPPWIFTRKISCDVCMLNTFVSWLRRNLEVWLGSSFFLVAWFYKLWNLIKKKLYDSFLNKSLKLLSVCFLKPNPCDPSHSKKDIPVPNFTIHEIHCSRNLEVCRYCSDSIPKSEMKNHIESEHVQVTNAVLP